MFEQTSQTETKTFVPASKDSSDIFGDSQVDTEEVLNTDEGFNSDDEFDTGGEDDLFADSTDDDTPPDYESDEEKENESEGEVPDYADIPIVYNGAKSKISDYTPEEIRATFQKGMNYDNIMAKYSDLQQQYQSNPALEYINELAEANGMTPEDFVEACRVQSYAEDNGCSFEQAKNFIDSDRIVKQYGSFLEQQEAAEAATQGQYSEFAERFPNVDANTIPLDVWDAFLNRGENLSNAYSNYLNGQYNSQLESRIKELETQIRATQQNQNARQKAMSSARSEGIESGDGFLSALFG